MLFNFMVLLLCVYFVWFEIVGWLCLWGILNDVFGVNRGVIGMEILGEGV